MSDHKQAAIDGLRATAEDFSSGAVRWTPYYSRPGTGNACLLTQLGQHHTLDNQTRDALIKATGIPEDGGLSDWNDNQTEVGPVIEALLKAADILEES